jgi:hypothetical protein
MAEFEQSEKSILRNNFFKTKKISTLYKSIGTSHLYLKAIWNLYDLILDYSYYKIIFFPLCNKTNWLLIKSFAESIKSSFIFSLLTEIELAVKALLASPFDLKNLFFV